MAAGFDRVIAVLDARMDEVYSAAYLHENGRWRQEGDFALGPPESVNLPASWAMAGNAFAAYGDRLPAGGPRAVAVPTAAALLRLAPALMAAGLAVPAAQALPLSIRDKVAQTTAERAAIRAVQAPRP
jgi:tRNA threonylcarbamoyladenosine biosynthesis protein TsaB